MRHFFNIWCECVPISLVIHHQISLSVGLLPAQTSQSPFFFQTLRFSDTEELKTQTHVFRNKICLCNIYYVFSLNCPYYHILFIFLLGWNLPRAAYGHVWCTDIYYFCCVSWSNGYFMDIWWVIIISKSDWSNLFTYQPINAAIFLFVQLLYMISKLQSFKWHWLAGFSHKMSRLYSHWVTQCTTCTNFFSKLWQKIR